MEIINRLLANYADLVFFIAIIEAIVIIILVIILFRRWNEHETRNNGVYGADLVKGKGPQASESAWILECNRLNRELNALKKKMKIEGGETYSSDARPNQFNNKTNNHTTTERADHSENDGWVGWARNQQAQEGVYVKQIKNSDGSETNEIVFDQTEEKPSPDPVPIKYEYLEAANSGQFRKLLPSEEKCFFRTWEENSIRKFEFHGNIDKALANINAIFDDVCEIEGKQNGASNIINLEPGILDSKLKVETPAKIKLT